MPTCYDLDNPRNTSSPSPDPVPAQKTAVRVPDAIENILQRGYWEQENRGVVNLRELVTEAIAAATFTDEERDAIREMARYHHFLRLADEASRENKLPNVVILGMFQRSITARDVVDAIPTDVLTRLAQEAE